MTIHVALQAIQHHVLVTVIAISYKRRANTFFLGSGGRRGGEGGCWQLPKHFLHAAKPAGKKNRERGATRKETEQVLSTIQGMLFDLKKFLAQAITYQKTHAQGP